jgi:acylphosphatase
VKNLLDGRVEAFVEGDQDAVTRVEQALRRGPPRARVDRVTIVDEEASGAFRGFSIR